MNTKAEANTIDQTEKSHLERATEELAALEPGTVFHKVKLDIVNQLELNTQDQPETEKAPVTPQNKFGSAVVRRLFRRQ